MHLLSKHIIIHGVFLGGHEVGWQKTLFLTADTLEMLMCALVLQLEWIRKTDERFSFGGLCGGDVAFMGGGVSIPIWFSLRTSSSLENARSVHDLLVWLLPSCACG